MAHNLDTAIMAMTRHIESLLKDNERLERNIKTLEKEIEEGKKRRKFHMIG